MFQTSVEKIKTRIECSITFPKNRAFYEVIWGEKNGAAEQATDYNTIRRMRYAFRINKATNTHSAYVMRISFPLQQWFHERA